MPDDGRLTAFLDEVHRRLAKARTTVRRDPPTVDQLLERRRARDQTEAAERDTAPDESRQTGGSTDTAEDRVLVTPPPDGADTDERSGSNFSIEEEPSSPRSRCKICGEALETSSPDRAQPSVCRECLTEGHETTPPTTSWRDATLGALSEAILQVLHAAYPDELSAPEIADRLRQSDHGAFEADKSDVNSKLYGPLHEWLEREGETPPYWSLKEANRAEGESQSADTAAASQEPSSRCSSCGEPIDDSPYIGIEGTLCETCAAVEREGQTSDTSWEEQVFDLQGEPSPSKEDRQTAPAEGSGSEDNSDASAEQSEGKDRGRPREKGQTQQAEAEKSVVNYELCHMCITEYPEESLTRYKGLQLCPGCLEEDQT